MLFSNLLNKTFWWKNKNILELYQERDQLLEQKKYYHTIPNYKRMDDDVLVALTFIGLLISGLLFIPSVFWGVMGLTTLSLLHIGNISYIYNEFIIGFLKEKWNQLAIDKFEKEYIYNQPVFVKLMQEIGFKSTNEAYQVSLLNNIVQKKIDTDNIQVLYNLLIKTQTNNLKNQLDIPLLNTTKKTVQNEDDVENLQFFEKGK